jgi:hypothetical protein
MQPSLMHAIHQACRHEHNKSFKGALAFLVAISSQKTPQIVENRLSVHGDNKVRTEEMLLRFNSLTEVIETYENGWKRTPHRTLSSG